MRGGGGQGAGAALPDLGGGHAATSPMRRCSIMPAPSRATVSTARRVRGSQPHRPHRLGLWYAPRHRRRTALSGPRRRRHVGRVGDRPRTQPDVFDAWGDREVMAGPISTNSLTIWPSRSTASADEREYRLPPDCVREHALPLRDDRFGPVALGLTRAARRSRSRSAASSSKRSKRLRQRRHVTVRDQQTILAMADQFRRTVAAIEGRHGQSRRHCLSERVAEPLVARREDEGVRLSHPLVG